MTATAPYRPTRAEIASLLADANRDTKRLPRVIETFTKDPPTKWSDAHDFLNELLDDYEQALH